MVIAKGKICTHQVTSCIYNSATDRYDITYMGGKRYSYLRGNVSFLRNLENIQFQSSEAARAVKKCPKCGNILRKRTGKFGEFLGCMSYPDCKYTENIDFKDSKDDTLKAKERFVASGVGLKVTPPKKGCS